jgi:pyruvate/2-oxoglutarate dehydrogenase complex dihydrolipoamide dehydrogenase (E3) component
MSRDCIDPPLARVGLTSKEAKAQGYHIMENTVPVNTIPRHKVNNDPRGLFKAVVDKALLVKPTRANGGSINTV